ncbi:amino acid adenylation domain-containing protein [Flaviramulus aquimarinus]|uniref:Amino acid adenylation domain-containing protein n=1 Tax=Flaviramulus aquimarinus TaxID=1170456 RepID=A0ABP9FF40_9FLAO
MNLINSLYNAFVQNKEKHVFCINDVFYTYENLLACIIKTRKIIADHIADNESFIGLVTNNDLETYATIFSIWMEGKAYIPVNPTAPISRNEAIFKAIDVHYVFDSSQKTDFTSFKVLNINHFENTTQSLSLFEPVKFDDKSIAYVLFTSGSTGNPKGVPISFKNLNALFNELDIDDEYKLKSSDRCLQMYDLTFDASLTALLPTLLVGACAYTVPSNVIKYLYVFKLLVKHKLTVLKMVPSIIYYLRPYFPEINATSVRYCVFGGEKLYKDIVDEWVKCIPNSKVLNHYGPTEFTVCSGYYNYKIADSNKSHNGVLSIGKPFKNVDYLILDGNNNVLPDDNVEGELCLAGNQLTQGYWKNDKLNASSFFINKTDLDVAKRFYKTGDLCYRDEDGFYMYVGRKDFQVKIGGYRVELGEIEYHARNHASTNALNLVVIDVKNSSNNDELVLVIESSKFDTTDLLVYMNEKLAEYMVPNKVFFLDKFPYNSNGKLDRKKLKELIG